MVARRLPTGVTVVTSGHGNDMHGMTVNSFATLSLSPPLVNFSVRRGARITALIDSTGGFVVNVLGADQHALARRFADPDRPTGADCFAAVETAGAHASSGMRLAGTIGHFACRAVHLIEAGDHTLVVGLVEECRVLGTADPLLFVNGEFRSVLYGSLQ
ncbi:flavin reductase family protein [Streptomyces malaysiensis]|uniref:flavin reductase family protein n=1 Tax=Streptomyces malaysiensis TaxID=92644 RepID=UPI00371FC7D0